VPFDTDDAMFHPPISGRLSAYEIPTVSYQEPSPLPVDSPQTPIPVRVLTLFFAILLFIYLNRIYFQNVIKERKSSSRNRIIPPDEDIRRLFQECKIGQGNASLLSQALALTKPEDLKRKEIIKVREPLIFRKRKPGLHSLVFAGVLRKVSFFAGVDFRPNTLGIGWSRALSSKKR
jgi:hypothetical protein